MIRAVIVAIAFAVIGPFVAATLLFAPVAVMSVRRAEQLAVSDLPAGLLQLYAFFALWGYIIGGLSALLAGVALGARTLRSGTFGYGETVAVSVAAAVAGSVIALSSSSSANSFATVAGLLLWLVPLGVVSGLICHFILARLRVLPPRTNHATSQPERN